MASIRLYTAQSYTWYCIYSCVLTPTQNCRTVLYAQWCKSQITRMLYDLNHCAYKSSSAGYNCKWSIVYKTVLCDRIDTVSVRSFVFTSGTPASLSDCVFLDDWITPIVVIWRVDNNRGEQVLSFRMQKWI